MHVKHIPVQIFQSTPEKIYSFVFFESCEPTQDITFLVVSHAGGDDETLAEMLAPAATRAPPSIFPKRLSS